MANQNDFKWSEKSETDTNQIHSTLFIRLAYPSPSPVLRSVEHRLVSYFNQNNKRMNNNNLHCDCCIPFHRFVVAAIAFSVFSVHSVSAVRVTYNFENEIYSSFVAAVSLRFVGKIQMTGVNFGKVVLYVLCQLRTTYFVSFVCLCVCLLFLLSSHIFFECSMFRSRFPMYLNYCLCCPVEYCVCKSSIDTRAVHSIRHSMFVRKL